MWRALEHPADKVHMDEQETFVLRCPAGEYAAPSLGRLLWLIFKHRTWHLFRGEGWVD